jgi:hypothetical protein
LADGFWYWIYTWYPFQSGLWGAIPWVGVITIGTKGVSFNFLEEDHEEEDCCDTPLRAVDPPLPNPDWGSPPPTVVGSGWLNLQFDPNLQEPVRM